MTSSNRDKPSSPLVHVHVCTHCGGAFRRELFEGRMHSTGIYPCPKCGNEGPLNIEIHPTQELEIEFAKEA
jgi:predicted RNA-binding Zn-ribbon protein involved in translation (DUF1610 family)